MKKYIQSFVCGFLSCGVIGLAAIVLLSYSGVLNLDGVMAGGNASLKSKIETKATLIERYIDQYFLDEVDEEKMADSIYKGIVSGMGDEYAAYYTKDEYETITEKTSGTYCGIGAYVTTNTETGAITIIKPITDGPADKAGLKAGDIIYAVDGTKVTGEDLSQVLALIKGEVGTQVKLQIVRSGESDYLDFTLTREEIKEDTVNSRMLSDTIGYIQVTSFEEVTPEQFQDALTSLQKEGMKALVVDLRDNGGGLLNAAVDMLDMMLPKGLVVYTEDKKGVAEEYYAEDDDEIKMPVAILVNGNSASASEVFAGAMQDEQKAKLVGTTTFGKGIVQTIFDLQDGSALKMTTSKYYTPKGRNIHGTGLKPDIEVELDKSTLQQTDQTEQETTDNQMQKAMEYLQGELN
ncbi:MAG: S41 family peptidase [Eubacteriales bacterium]|nr:S41 family peptidase [Eubacteriales bacterium]